MVLKVSLRGAVFPGMTVVKCATATFPPGQVCDEAIPVAVVEIASRSSQ